MSAAKTILTAGVMGTNAMTAFSYLVSEEKNRQFREPELLEKLLARLAPQTNDRLASAFGWAAHYSVGVGFTTIYHSLWRQKKNRPSLFGGILLGGISGLLGVAVWSTVFYIHPDPPKINYKRFYAHLLAAHLIFGGVAALTYKSLKKH
jgi:hypothetical protein